MLGYCKGVGWILRVEDREREVQTERVFRGDRWGEKENQGKESI